MLVDKLKTIAAIDNVAWMPMTSHDEMGDDSYIFQYAFTHNGVQKFGASIFSGDRSNDKNILNQVELTMWFQDAAEHIAASVR